MFVNLQLKNVLTGNGTLRILWTFQSISWQFLKITKNGWIEIFVQLVLPQHVKNLILLLIADRN